MLVPKLFTTFKTYTRDQLLSDLIAGVVVGIVALPLSIAFAIASGVTPQAGLITAIVAGFLISALGGSRVQIGGPTGAFVVIVYGIVQQYGVDGLAVATLMGGVILVALGLSGLGSAIKFIPRPVVTGFTSGIALIIFSSQVKDLLGLRMGDVPADFFEKWRAFAAAAPSLNPNAVGVAALALVIIIFWPRVTTRVPGTFVALIVTSVLVAVTGLEVETIGTRFGEISGRLPTPSIPSVDFDTARTLVSPAITIALLAGIESLLSAVVADGMIGGRHRSNMELVAQGVANVASPLFGGIPATGAIARTAVNVKNGGRTPVAGIVHALTLLLITLFFGRWVSYIPFAALGAILVVVAYHMSEWHAFVGEFTAPKSDAAVMMVTFLLTVVVDLTVAIQVGVVLAALLFIRRMSEVTNVRMFTRELSDDDDRADLDPNAASRREIPDGVVVFEINGPFFFGAAQTFKERLETVLGHPKVLILRLRNVLSIDSTGLHLLREVARRARSDKTLFLLADVHAQPMFALVRSNLIDEIGQDAVFSNLDDALNRAREHLGLPKVQPPEWAVPTVRREQPGLPERRKTRRE